MGPSGAGKSTLLYALMGTARYGVARGRLCVNGREMRLERLRRILGYVPQVRGAPRLRSGADGLPGRRPRGSCLCHPSLAHCRAFLCPDFLPHCTDTADHEICSPISRGHLGKHISGGMHMSLGLVAG